MINHFTFNGTSTAQLGLIVSGVSIFGAGSRKVEKAGIPGRNGDLQIELGGFNNYTVRYTVSITKNFTTTAQQIREWLLESKGYCNLTDTYHPDEIRKACFNSDIEFTTSMLYKYGQASIQFDCLPERYLTTNTPITTTATADTTTDTTMSLSTVPTPINISLNGNTTQEGSSGKNLFGFIASDFTGAYGSANYVEITGLTEGTYYTCSSNAPTGYIWFGKNANSSQGTINFNRVYEGNPVTVQVDSMEKITVGILASDKTTALSYNTQIEQGSTATSYEPHISPTNPQVIHNVSGNNEVKVIGKNVFDYLAWANGTAGIRATTSVSGNNFTITATGNDAYTQYGGTYDALFPRVTANTTYTFSWKVVSSTGTGEIYIFSESGSVITHIPAINNHYVTFNSGNSTYIKFRLGATNSGDSITFTDLQFEKGSARTYYEPYTRQSYPLYLPVENLWNNEKAVTDSNNSKVYIDGEWLHFWTGSARLIYNIESTEQLTFQAIFKSETVNENIFAFTTYYTDGTSDRLLTLTTNDMNEHFISGTTTAGKTVSYFRTIWTDDRGGFLKNVQLEKGTNANTYNPYGTPPIELNKIGTYQDYIYKNGGKWYVHKEIGRYAFIGANEEGWTLTSSYTNNTRYSEAIITARTSGSALSNYFTKGTAGTDTTNIDINGSNGKIMITIPNTIASTVNDLKTWLSTHNTEVYYVLATPTNTEITDTTLINQLNNIEKAYSYNGTTNILQVSNDNGFMLEVVSLHGSTFNSNYKGEPIITVNATGLIYLNGEVMEVLSAPVTINCQTMQCYNGVINMNNEVRVNDFPEIKIGANEVGSSMALTITPNNWRH